jgi:NAD(P)-dependent dehydrogenase (short-subunit alcohol dehydrogenase family)
MRLVGRRILVTGAASGIGRAIAGLFHREGARVALLDRNQASLDRVDEITLPSIRVVADVSRESELQTAVDATCREFGGLEGVVNCAGIDLMRPFAETSLEAWSQIMSVDLNGPFLVCRAALPALRVSGGTIVNISSAAGLRPLPHRTAYCSAKAGLVMFSKALAMDLAPDNIRVNVICPGITNTPQFRSEYESAVNPQEELAGIMSLYLIKRVADPQEIAAAALFLTSSESSYMTGAALAVDGGRSFH